MRTVIHKFKLTPGTTRIILPPESVALSAHAQNHEVYVWVKRPEERMRFRQPDTANTVSVMTFEVFATGEIFDDAGLQFIDTIHLDGMVWHVFQRT